MGMVEYIYAKALTEIILLSGDSLQEEKIDALRKIIGRANLYRKDGFLEDIICGFVQKKADMILHATRKGELNEITKPAKPYYDGNEIRSSSQYDTEEEEMILWSITSFAGPLVLAGNERYKKLFCKLLPEQAKQIFLEEFTERKKEKDVA